MNKKFIILFIIIIFILGLILLVGKRNIIYRKKNTLNYWINSLKYERLDEKKILVNKYKSKLYIKKYFPEIEVIKTLYIYNNPEDIKKINVPKYCVIKDTVGSGRNIIIKSENISKNKIIKITKKWLNNNYSKIPILYFHEPQYDTKSEIMIEEFMGYINDYKFFMIKGKLAFIQYDIDRYDSHIRNLYDENWNLLNFILGVNHSYKHMRPPKNLQKMKEFCYNFYHKTKFKFVRIDLYEINNKIYFGEFTFTPGCCLKRFSDNYDKILYNKYVKE